MSETKDGAATGRLRVADRIGALLEHLEIGAGHIGTSAPMELVQFMGGNPAALSSLTLLNSSRFPLDALSPIAERILAFTGDTGAAGDAMQQAKAALADAKIVEFANYPAAVWTDMAADHADRIAATMLDFLAGQDAARPATRLAVDERQGEAGGITFHVTGEGPALLLFPAMLAPSQWDPLVDRLAEKFSVVRLGGPHLGVVALLEERGADPSYHRVLTGMLQDARVGPSSRLLEVGCGSGVISRWLVREGLCAAPVTSFDLNPFLLREARSLAERDGLGGAIEFQQGNAEALPFPDDQFDTVLSVTVIEECDADKAIGEMARVVKPGGAVAILVRACDMPVFWNLPLDAEIKAKAEAPIQQVAPNGCADASLLPRLRAAGLEDVVAYPTFHGSKALRAYYEPIALSHLNDDEKAAWRTAKQAALADGTFTMMHPVHCAVGTKPR